MPKVVSLADFLGLDPSSGAPLPSEEFPDMSIKEFCQGVLRSPEYRRSVYQRILAGALPPAVELRMYDYAEGKPVDRVEHTGKDGKAMEMITEVRRVIVRPHEVIEEQEEPKPEVTH